jgi:hypothetical protein
VQGAVALILERESWFLSAVDNKIKRQFCSILICRLIEKMVKGANLTLILSNWRP